MDQAIIYEQHAEAYDALVAAEDVDGNLMPALESVSAIDGAAILDVGCGTGRISRLVAGRARRVVGVDRARAMLVVARRHRNETRGGAGWTMCRADAQNLPVAPAWADLAIAGWAFGHFTHWLPDEWRASIDKCLAEMTRAIRPGGVLCVVETLGTGTSNPAPPNDALARYYEWLVSTHGLARLEIRTDYRFPDVTTAASVTGFFFGSEFGERVRMKKWARVPEFTGVWWKRV